MRQYVYYKQSNILYVHFSSIAGKCTEFTIVCSNDPCKPEICQEGICEIDEDNVVKCNIDDICAP